jgi:hypothetical protein
MLAPATAGRKTGGANLMEARNSVGKCRVGVLSLLACGLSFVACNSSSDKDGKKGSDAGTLSDASNVGDASGGNLFGQAGGDSGAGVIGVDAACGSNVLSADGKPTNILIVLDKSGSMNDPLIGGGSDKWTAMRTALATALPEVQDDISFGLDLFPNDTTDAGIGICALPTVGVAPVVGVQAGAAAVTQILSAIDSTGPSGGTPTAGALARALDYFTNGAGAALTGPGQAFLSLGTG